MSLVFGLVLLLFWRKKDLTHYPRLLLISKVRAPQSSTACPKLHTILLLQLRKQRVRIHRFACLSTGRLLVTNRVIPETWVLEMPCGGMVHQIMPKVNWQKMKKILVKIDSLKPFFRWFDSAAWPKIRFRISNSIQWLLVMNHWKIIFMENLNEQFLLQSSSGNE